MDTQHASVSDVKTSSVNCCTCWRRRRISRSWLSTLKADFSALQWIQLSLHHAEGLSLQNARERSPCSIKPWTHSKWETDTDISLHTQKLIIWMHLAALSSEVLYLDLHDWNTLSSVAKSFMPPLLAASALCFLSASFCLSGWPAGRKRSTKCVNSKLKSSHNTSTSLHMPFPI